MGLVDIDAVEKEAQRQLQEEAKTKAVKKLKDLYKKKSDAEAIVRNIDREIADAKASIGEGSAD